MHSFLSKPKIELVREPRLAMSAWSWSGGWNQEWSETKWQPAVAGQASSRKVSWKDEETWQPAVSWKAEETWQPAVAGQASSSHEYNAFVVRTEQQTAPLAVAGALAPETTPATAVAAAVAAVDVRPREAASAPAVAENLFAFTLESFQSWKEFTNSYKQHNAALKWFRHLYEDSANPFNSNTVEFDNNANAAVAAIVKDKGMDYTFNENDMQEWSWQEMIASLDRESMEYVVNGLAGRSGGVVGCSFSVRANSYDHKRQHMLREVGRPIATKLPIWDFVVHRADGSGIRLHPEWSKPKVESFEAEGFQSEVAAPKAGLGKSDGRGTYSLYKTMGNDRTLRFDAQRINANMKKSK